jgi:four helix bundle protein
MQNHQLLAFQRLDVYQVALEYARKVHEARIGDAELRDQASRAAKSAFLHVCEGLPNESTAMRRKYFTGANNSLCESIGAVHLSLAIGAVAADRASELQELAVRLKQLIRGLQLGHHAH